MAFKKERKPKMIYEPSIIKETNQGYYSIPIRDVQLEERIVELTEEVSDESTNSLCRQLRYLDTLNHESEITMYINSPGGSVQAGLALIDTITMLRCPVHMIVQGMAASMAAVIFSCGNIREMLPSSMIMIHDPSIQEAGGTALQMNAISHKLMKTREKTASILAKNTNHSLNEIYALTSTDTYMSAEEAVQFGIADKISEKKGDKQL